MENLQENRGNKNNLINTQIKGDNNTVSNNFTSKEVKPERVKRKPLKFFGKQFKISWIKISGFVAFLASLATIYSTIRQIFYDKNQLNEFSTSSNFSIILFFTIVIFFLCMLLLQILKDSVLVLGNYKIASHGGKLYVEDYKANCPICDGSMKTTSFKGISYLKCRLYNEHIFRFNPKIFDDEYYK